MKKFIAAALVAVVALGYASTIHNQTTHQNFTPHNIYDEKFVKN